MKVILAVVVGLTVMVLVFMSGIHICPDEVGAAIQVWGMIAAGLFEHLPVFFHLPRLFRR